MGACSGKQLAAEHAALSPKEAGPTPCLCWSIVSRAVSGTAKAKLSLTSCGSTRSSTSPSSFGSSHNKKLLDKYSLGKVLGQGAFGIVYSCKNRKTREEFAVKMIDRVEMPLADIEREASMLRRLAHPCVVRLHDVYFEKVFVCMVLDLLGGGDMIDGMQRHWRSKGMIPIPVVQNISKMMVQGVAWLHQNRVVHRDLKGDNFLMDRKAIEDRNCRVFLSDFGTVVELQPKERLREKCGTKTYWSPEFYDFNYSFGVDVWAIGVIVYGLASGRFPFKTELDVRTKPVKCPQRLPKIGEAFICATLTRNEATRPTAKQSLEHAFLSSIKSAAQAAIEKVDAGFVPELKETGANAAVQQRRHELMERIANAKGNAEIATHFSQIAGNYQVHDKFANNRRDFEWWPQARVQEARFIDLSVAQKVRDLAALSNAEEGIQQLLKDHDIQTSQFGHGQAKGFASLVKEVQSGQSLLMLDAAKHKTVVRVVDLVLIRLYHGTGSSKRYLIKLSETFPDGRLRKDIKHVLPGTKKLPFESARQTVLRVLEDKVGIDSASISFDWSRKEYFEEDEISPSYPGVRTVYRKEIYEGSIVTADPAFLAKYGLQAGSGADSLLSHICPEKYTRTYTWMTKEECQAKEVVVRAPTEGTEVSSLVHAPGAFCEAELHKFLQHNGVDVSELVAEKAKKLKNLTDELVRGEAQLTRKSDGTIVRMVDVVILQISKSSGEVLVGLTPENATAAGRLPAVKRRPDENPFWAAKRVLSKELKISENLVRVDPNNVLFTEEETTSQKYLGLPTIYRRLVIPATLEEEE